MRFLSLALFVLMGCTTTQTTDTNTKQLDMGDHVLIVHSIPMDELKSHSKRKHKASAHPLTVLTRGSILAKGDIFLDDVL